jgi:hypothetical protein
MPYNWQTRRPFSSTILHDRAVSSAARRLEQSIVRLTQIDLMREFLEDAAFGRSVEERIIRRELIELELQYVDEELERISVASGRAANDKPGN